MLIEKDKTINDEFYPNKVKIVDTLQDKYYHIFKKCWGLTLLISLVLFI